MSTSSSPSGKPWVLFDRGEPVLGGTAWHGVRPQTATLHKNTAGENERRTLLTGMHYEIAATHSDPRAFFDRMVHQYGLKLKRRA